MFFRSTLTGVFAVLLLTIPPVNVTLYSTVSLGGYGEALLVSNLLFVTGFLLLKSFEVCQLGGITSQSSEIDIRYWIVFFVNGIGYHG